MKGGCLKEVAMVTDEGELSIGYIYTFVTSRAVLTKELST